jgi:oligoribonuclease NrnB/cAMP/cGMP phosphodiesterase (DHH superfamily)
MINLTKKEKKEILRFSSNYINLHNEIVKVESEIKNLEERSSELIQDLEACREEESRFMEALNKKYGEGQIDPMSLCWSQKKLIQNDL